MPDAPAAQVPSGFVPDTAPAQKSWMDSLKDYAAEAFAGVNPKAVVQGVNQAVLHPIDTASAMLQAQGDVKDRAEAAFKRGDYAEGVAHTLYWLMPMIGPRLDQAGNYLRQGEIAKGLGATTDVALQTMGPEVAGRALSAIPRPSLQAANPAVRDAVAFGRQAGVPIDAATATNNPAVRMVQNLADRSLGGAQVAQRAQYAQAQKLASFGEQLAAKGYQMPQTAEQAGEAVSSGVTSTRNTAATAANTAYDTLRQIEADPANAVTVQPPVAAPNPNAPLRFTLARNANANQIFLGALQDAKANGFTGSAAELKALFDDRVASAQSLKAATEEGAAMGPEALLADIRRLGGIRSWEPDLSPGQLVKMRGEYDNLKSLYRNRGIFTENGVAIDDVIDQLRQDPRWKQVLTDNPEDLKSMLEEIATAPSSAGKDLQGYLEGAGVKPGTQWWKEQAAPQSIPMAVDFGPARQVWQPVYDALKQESQLAPAGMMGSKAQALLALDKMMNGPQHVPFSVADGVLSDLKRFANSGDPSLRTAGQAAIQRVIPSMDAQVWQAASAAGPDAVKALQAGRTATTAKYAAQDVLDTLSDEPVTTTRGLTRAGDASIEKLRAVAEQAPETLPMIGRSVLDGLLERARDPAIKSGTSGLAHADRIYSDWQQLGPQTKALLFKDPQYISDLDKYFLLVKKIAENPNVSGSSYGVAALGQASQILHPLNFAASVLGSAGVSALLHSDAGVRLLIGGANLPPVAAVRNAWIAQAKNFIRTSAVTGEAAAAPGGGGPP